MKIDVTDAQQLGALDAQNKELSVALKKSADDYVALFRSTCERHGLDPMKVAIDFETGEVLAREPLPPREPKIGRITPDMRGG